MVLEGYFSKLNEDLFIDSDEEEDVRNLIGFIDEFLNKHYKKDSWLDAVTKASLLEAKKQLLGHLDDISTLFVPVRKGVKESYDDKETWNTDYEPEFKYTIAYEGALFEGDSDGYNEHYTDSWNECVSLLNAYGDDVRIRIYDNKYNAVYDSLEKMWESKNKKKTVKMLNEAYHKISTADLQNIISQIEDLIDEMDHSEIDAISPDPNTYGIGAPFIGTYEGYIDLSNWGKYIGEDEEDEYDESLKKVNKPIKEGLSEIEYLTDKGYEELKQLIKKFYPQYKTVREFMDNYDRDKIEVIGVEQLDEIPDYENAFEIDSWDMSQGTGNVIARVFLATNGKLYGYADF